MGGESKTSQTQSSTTAPWEAAQPALNGILGQLGTNLNNTGVTGAENNALNTTQANANNYSSTYAPQINANAQNLLNGGGATAQAGNIQGGYGAFKNQMSPFADPNYSSMNDPNLQRALQQIQSDVGNN